MEDDGGIEDGHGAGYTIIIFDSRTSIHFPRSPRERQRFRGRAGPPPGAPRRPSPSAPDPVQRAGYTTKRAVLRVQARSLVVLHDANRARRLAPARQPLWPSGASPTVAMLPCGDRAGHQKCGRGASWSSIVGTRVGVRVAVRCFWADGSGKPRRRGRCPPLCPPVHRTPSSASTAGVADRRGEGAGGGIIRGSSAANSCCRAGESLGRHVPRVRARIGARCRAPGRVRRARAPWKTRRLIG